MTDNIDFKSKNLKFYLGGQVDYRPLRFFKSIIAFIFLGFSFLIFDFNGPTNDIRFQERSHFSSLIFLWGTSIGSLTSFIVGLEATLYFSRLRLKLFFETTSDFFPFRIYIYKSFIYSSYWLFILVASTYIESIIELLYDKKDFEILNKESPINFEAIIINTQGIVLIAIISVVLVKKSKSVIITPWVAMVISALYVQIFSKFSNNNKTKDIIAISASELYSFHSKQLGIPLLDRSFPLYLGALCAIYLLRDLASSNVIKSKLKSKGSNDSLNKVNSSSSKKISSKNYVAKNNFFELILAKILFIISIFFIVYPIDFSSYNFLQIDGFQIHQFSVLFYSLFDVCRQFSWAYLFITCSVDETNIHSNSFFKSISRNAIWSGVAKFVYPTIFIIRYPIFEQIVKMRFGFFSLNQFLIFIFCCYLMGLNKERRVDELKVLSVPDLSGLEGELFNENDKLSTKSLY